MEPLPLIAVALGCNDNVGSGNTPVIYSDNLLLLRSQWGFLQVDAYRQGGQLKNGLTKTSSEFCPGAAPLCGDCPAAVHSIRATSNQKKWVVAVGLGQSCTVCPEGDNINGMQVWLWTGNRYVWKGLIEANVDSTPAPFNMGIIGDIAYCIAGSGNSWYQFDLVAMTAAEFVGSPPGFESQSAVAGFTYKFSKQSVGNFTFTREGASTLPTFCPDDKISRKQVAAIVYNTVKWMVQHPGAMLPLPPDQQFSDVPLDNPFRPATDSLKEAGIVAGKSPCGS